MGGEVIDDFRVLYLFIYSMQSLTCSRKSQLQIESNTKTALPFYVKVIVVGLTNWTQIILEKFYTH